MIDENCDRYSLRYTRTSEIAVKECNKIEKVRSRLYSLGLIGAYCDGFSFGDISLRYKKKNSFIITSTQTGEFPKLTPNYYSLVKKVDFKKFTTYAIGPAKPSTEAITHACIYALDSQINAVIHIHNEKLWDYMFKNGYLNTKETLYGSYEMYDDIKKMYKDVDPFLNNSFVMKGHYEGIVTFGKTLKDAEKALFEIIQKLLK